MPWKLTVRAGPRIERRQFDELDQALNAIDARCGELSVASLKQPVDVRFKRFEPIQQVSARIELAGPERLIPSTRAGLDVRGDGSTEAYLGRVRRQVIEQRKGETSYEALRRALQPGSEG